MVSTILRAGDDRVAPLVCVHPVSGRAEDYQHLAAAIDWPGRVIGISAPDAGETGFHLSDLAKRYTDELELRGPVLLLGWSIGGVIAAEIATTIHERGGDVAFLGILDSRAPQPEMRKRPIDRDTIARAFLQHAALTRELTPLPPPSSTTPADLLASLRALGVGEPADEVELERRLAIFMALVRAFYHHDQRPIPVKLHLFGADDEHAFHPRPPTLGWDDLAPSIEHGTIAGTHYTLMAPRRAVALAQTISRCLPRV